MRSLGLAEVAAHGDDDPRFVGRSVVGIAGQCQWVRSSRYLRTSGADPIGGGYECTNWVKPSKDYCQRNESDSRRIHLQKSGSIRTIFLPAWRTFPISTSLMADKFFILKSAQNVSMKSMVTNSTAVRLAVGIQAVRIAG